MTKQKQKVLQNANGKHQFYCVILHFINNYTATLCLILCLFPNYNLETNHKTSSFKTFILYIPGQKRKWLKKKPRLTRTIKKLKN